MIPEWEPGAVPGWVTVRQNGASASFSAPELHAMLRRAEKLGNVTTTVTRQRITLDESQVRAGLEFLNRLRRPF